MRERLRTAMGLGATLALLAFPPAAAASPATVDTVTADFNGDGFSELVVGAPGQQVSGALRAGSVHVFYAAPDGISPEREQLFDQSSPEVEDEPGTGDGFGTALAAGDFNGDGFDDLVIGVPGESAPGANASGAVEVLFGSAFGLTAAGDQILRGTGSGDRSPESGDRFGSALTAGDFDGDGHDDLAVGSPGEDLGSPYAEGGAADDAGAIFIVQGSPAGLPASAFFFTEGSRGIGGEPAADDRFGAALTSADFGRGTRSDLAVGTPGAAVGGLRDPAAAIPDAGRVTVMYGSSVGPAAVGSKTLDQDSRGIVGAAQEGDGFGSALAAADFDHKNVDDLAVGVPSDQVSGLTAGAVNVIYSRVRGLAPPGNRRFTQDSRGVGEFAEAEDRFGSALAAANFGNRVSDDLAIGAPGDTVEGGPEVGTAVALYGSSERRALSGKGSDLFRQGRRRVPDVAEAGDRFGASLAAGSFGLGGNSDLAIGVPNEGFDGPPPTPGAGAVTVRFGHRSGLSGPGPLLAEGQAGVDGVMEPGDAFGAAFAPSTGR